MGLVRAFIACEFSDSLQDAIQSATTDFRAGLGSNLVRWVPARKIHLTLKFLGDIPETSLESIQGILMREAARYAPFEIVVEGIGAFPNPRRPRVLWVGLSAPPELTSLQREIDLATEKLGYKSDFKDFSPHLTIGRVQQAASAVDQQRIREGIAHAQVGRIGSQHVDAVHLIRSDLQASGSVYTELFSAHLAST